MPADSPLHIPELDHLTLRVLEEPDPESGGFLARCLETGTVAAAPDIQTLRQLFDKTLELEILLAIRNKDFANLLRRPVSGDVAARWLRAAANKCEDTTLKLNLPVEVPPRREVKSEIAIKKASLSRTA